MNNDEIILDDGRIRYFWHCKRRPDFREKTAKSFLCNNGWCKDVCSSIKTVQMDLSRQINAQRDNVEQIKVELNEIMTNLAAKFTELSK